FNGYDFQGRNLNVNEARERTPGGPRPGGYAGGGYAGGGGRGGYGGGGGGGRGGYGGGDRDFGGGGGDFGGGGGGGDLGGFGGGFPPLEPLLEEVAQGAPAPGVRVQALAMGRIDHQEPGPFGRLEGGGVPPGEDGAVEEVRLLEVGPRGVERLGGEVVAVDPDV